MGMSSSKEMGPSTSPGVRKSVRLSNQNTPSPLRRSDRCKKFIPSSSPGQKQSAEIQVELESVARKRLTSHARKKLRIQEIESGPETTPPISEGENHSVSGICDLCSKRKRVSSGSPDNEHCSCGANGDVNIGKNIGSYSMSKDIDDHGASITIGSAKECDSRNLIEEPHSDDQMDGNENACSDCSDNCDLFCCTEKNSKMKTPQQKDLITPSPRNRKRKQLFDKSSSKRDKENDDVRKKRRKMVREITDTTSVQIELDEHQTTPVPSSEGGLKHSDGEARDSISLACNEVQSLQKNGATSENNLNGISNERSIAAEADDVGTIYRRVVKEITDPPSVQIELDGHQTTPVPSSEGGDSTQINCNEVQSLQENGATSDNNLNRISNESSIAAEGDALNPDCSENTIDPVRDFPLTEEDVMEPSSVKQECSPPASDKPELKIRKIAPRGEFGWSAIDDPITEIQKMCYKRQKKLQREQKEKIMEVHKIWDEKKQKLEEAHLSESAFFRSSYGEVSLRVEKLKGLDDCFANELEQHNLLRDTELKKLEAQQVPATNQEKQKAERWLAEACPSEPRAVNGQQSPCPQYEPRNEVQKDRFLQSSAELVAEDEQISRIVVSETAPADTVTAMESDAPATEDQNPSLVATSELADTVTPLPLNTEAPAIVNIEPTDNVSVEAEHPYSDEIQNSSQTVEAAETEVISTETISQDNDNSEIQSNHPELPISYHNDTAISVTVISAAELPNQAVDSSNLSPLFYDHFQHEFERIVKEMECLEKRHHDTSSQIATDCEKEMNDLRLKYEMQLQNARADFRLKQSELEKNKNKVHMTEVLGMAFNLKWSACWPCVLPGLQQGTSSSFTLQMHQQSAQPLMRFPFSLGPSSFQTSPSPQISTPTQQTPLHQNPSPSHPTRPALPVTVQTVTSRPPLQHPAPLFSYTPPRPPPLISSITPTLNPRIGSDIRSPAPHLQLFQSATATSSTPPHLQPRQILSHQPPREQTQPSTSQSGPCRFPAHPSSITPVRNHFIGSDIRAPAPHLRPFRPTTATSSTPPHQQPNRYNWTG